MTPQIHDWTRIPVEQLSPGMSRQCVHTAQMTVAVLRLERGSVVPRHSHANEQVTVLRSGRLRFVFDDGERLLDAGCMMEIPGGVAHRVEALEDCVAMDLFTPPREDWIRGDDAYLRSGSR